MTLSSLLLELPKLNEKELKAVKAVAEKLLGAERHIAGPEQELFGGLQWKLVLNLSWAQFQASQAGKAWPKGAAAALALAERAFTLGQRPKPQRVAIYGLLWGLVFDDLQAKRIPLTPLTMTQGLARLPMTFEDAYPGYLSANLTHVILAKLFTTK